MTKTADLIASLSADAKPVKPLKAPSYFAPRILGVLAAYGVLSQYFLGFRPDLIAQLSRPFFAFEILALITLLISSTYSCILSIYPDAYQKSRLVKLPYTAFLALAGIVGLQLALPYDARMVVPPPGSHTMECALCIAAVALLPAGLIFSFLRKGATVHQVRSGAFAVLASSAVGGLTLRLAEANDSILHLIAWHYAPTLLFAVIGALLGKWLLKW